MDMAGLTVSVAGLDFVSPVVIPAGPGGFGSELRQRYDLRPLGAFTVKTLTPRLRLGNPPPRFVDTGFGLINSIGLQNPGLRAFLDDVYPALLPFPTHLFLSIAGESVSEFVDMARTLAGVGGFDLLELNLSCPNVEASCGAIGTDPESVRDVVRAVRRIFPDRPIAAKLPFEVPDMASVVRACEEEGTDALTLFNCPQAARFDVTTGQPFLARVTGGFSGPALKPLTLAKLLHVRSLTRLPIIGMGGAWTSDDVLEFRCAGADLVGMGLHTMQDPAEVCDIARRLSSVPSGMDGDSVV
jgi:dihydroorotate dehydrogenase (NAD+) catalytic subunit